MKLPVAPMSRRARNLVVDTPRVAAMNLRWKRDELAVEMMVLRRRCSLPKRTSRSCRACSSTTSEKVIVDAFGGRVEEHEAVGGVCDAWESSGGGGIAGEGEGKRIGDVGWAIGATKDVTDGWFVGAPIGDNGSNPLLLGGSDGGGVFGGNVVEKVGAGGTGGGLVVGVEESIVVEHAREEVSKGHVGFVGEGGCKVFVAYSFDAGDERTVGNDGVGEVVSEGADVLDEAVRGTGLAEVAELFKVVVNGFLGPEGGSEAGGPLEEGVARSSGGSAVASFSHPPFGCIAEEAGGGNGEPVGKGHVVELK
ncbi:hypothetical protein CBR_g17017 [Chara braunii]|uniref:Uncharacterized protein n=1 Tax=Chara braunii TaxID=69332 RepID=A0A388KUD2_CHABU|nr:hypothetical protein CBR_g17017 [Chara braunii]|eukprot:GBG73675.1 hypothetical protein CBR_g17017 [Chara braunii]